MSDLLFPTLKGLTYPITMTPHWNTLTNQSVTGIKKFLSMYSYPYYQLKLSFEYLSDSDDESDDIHQLMGFYNSMGGAGQDFLFADPLFLPNKITDHAFGTGDGTKTKFRLARNFGDAAEPVFGILAAPKITKTIDGTVTALTTGTDFTWDATALIAFAKAPEQDAVLRWSGDWYFRCHFAEDEAEFQQIFYQGWGLDDLTLETIKLE